MGNSPDSWECMGIQGLGVEAVAAVDLAVEPEAARTVEVIAAVAVVDIGEVAAVAVAVMAETEEVAEAAAEDCRSYCLDKKDCFLKAGDLLAGTDSQR